MDLEKLEKMIQLVSEDLGSEYLRQSKLQYSNMRVKEHPDLDAKVKNILSLALKTLPEHEDLLAITYKNINKETTPLRLSQAIIVLSHLREIIEIEKSSEAKIQEMKIFESAEEKMKQAGLSFRREDYTSCFSNLDTALEMVLKDKLRIPLTITKVNISKIVDILVSHKVEPYLYLVEARKHITQIDNKIKHQGYSPSKSDCIFGIKAMEELLSRLRDMKVNLTDEVRNKIYEGL